MPPTVDAVDGHNIALEVEAKLGDCEPGRQLGRMLGGARDKLGRCASVC